MAERTPVFIVHDLSHASAALRAAREAGCAVTLRSAPGAAVYAGLGYLRALFEKAAELEPGAEHDVVLDIGPGAALAHEAMRFGFSRLAFSGRKALRSKLDAIAAAQGATVLPGAPPRDALDLLDSPEPFQACRDHLAKRRRGHVR